MLFNIAEGFGTNRFDPNFAAAEIGRIDASRKSTLRDGVRASAPRTPGIYGMLDRAGRLIYVGKAKILRARLMSYFRTGSRDPKAGRIIQHSKSIVWESGPNEFAALLRELELIRRYRPNFNVQGQPGRRRFVYLVLGRSPAPYFHVLREVPKQAYAIFGPLPGGRRLAEAVRRLNDHYGLRDCRQTQSLKFADQQELFPVLEPAGCLRYEIGTCLGPCIAAITRDKYNHAVRKAKAYLEGRDPGPIPGLNDQMKRAAAEFAFERAAGFRDRILDLEWLNERLAWLDQARQEYSFIYSLDRIWYLIRAGRVLAATHAPHGSRGSKTALKALDAVYPLKGGPPLVPGDVTDHVMLVAAWFRRHPEDRRSVIDVPTARQLCLPIRASA